MTAAIAGSQRTGPQELGPTRQATSSGDMSGLVAVTGECCGEVWAVKH
jgi:hypothetical protein